MVMAFSVERGETRNLYVYNCKYHCRTVMYSIPINTARLPLQVAMGSSIVVLTRRYSYPCPSHRHTPAPSSPSQCHYPAHRPPLCLQTHLNLVNAPSTTASFLLNFTYLPGLPLPSYRQFCHPSRPPVYSGRSGSCPTSRYRACWAHLLPCS